MYQVILLLTLLLVQNFANSKCCDWRRQRPKWNVNTEQWDKIGVAVQSWIWERVELIIWELSWLEHLNGIQWSWVQIPLRPTSIATSKNPSVVNTIYKYIYNIYIYIYIQYTIYIYEYIFRYICIYMHIICIYIYRERERERKRERFQRFTNKENNWFGTYVFGSSLHSNE